MKFRWLFILVTGICLQVLSAFCPSLAFLSPAATPSPGENEQQQVEAAIYAAVARQPESLLAYHLYETQVDNLAIEDDGEWAIAWLNPVDPETGEVVPAEPGLAVVRKENGRWRAILPGDPGWQQAVLNVPEEILPQSEKEGWLQLEAQVQAALPSKPLTGYLLPWAAGEKLYLTQSVQHDRYDPSGKSHYSFDFAAPHDSSGKSPMFAVHAAKAGIVVRARWIQENGSETSPGNYIVLEDRTTNPVSYQLYLHLAQDSIPPALRVPGAVVVQGQFLGLADDTGKSSGNHLHFMVHTNPASYWGQSVDIVFDDVSINGGRPRSKYDRPYCKKDDVCTETAETYISKNVPRGGYTAPACVPGPLQVALFSEVDYSGSCVLLEVGDHSASKLGPVGTDQTTSLMVGSDVYATLFDGSDLTGRSETFTTSDSSLADNRIGAKTASSVRVGKLDEKPHTPQPVWPNNINYPSDATIPFSWYDAGGGVQFQVLISGTASMQSGWLDEPFWHVSGLAPGSYQWQVQARGAGGQVSDLSTALTFSISQTSFAGQDLEAPYSTDVNTCKKDGWTNSNYWDLTDAENNGGGAGCSWMYDTGRKDYDTGEPNSGYLTSPPIQIPAQGVYYLRFWSLYETETRTAHWDQRRVQISVDSGPFEDLYQLEGDPPNIWLESPAISLQAYAGKTVRLRFYFSTLDALRNKHLGWFVDDISITAAPPPCEADGSDTPQQAAVIRYNESFSERICPNGDVDYYEFSGRVGDLVEVKVNTANSSLQPSVFLLDSDGRSILVEAETQLTYELKRSGSYYIKVAAWQGISGGGETASYTLTLKGTGRDTQNLYLPLIQR